MELVYIKFALQFQINFYQEQLFRLQDEKETNKEYYNAFRSDLKIYNKIYKKIEKFINKYYYEQERL